MLSKEEIEKAKERLSNLGKSIQVNCKEKSNMATSIKILLQYIQELEISNKELDKENNRLEKIEFERDKANKIIDEMLEEYEYNARCNLKNFCDEEMRKDKCKQDCRACIKQYFEKKVEGK